MPSHEDNRMVGLAHGPASVLPMLEVVPVVHLGGQQCSAPFGVCHRELGEALVCNFVAVHPEVTHRDVVIRDLTLENTTKTHGVPTLQLRDGGRCCPHAKRPSGDEHRPVLVS